MVTTVTNNSPQAINTSLFSLQKQIDDINNQAKWVDGSPIYKQFFKWGLNHLPSGSSTHTLDIKELKAATQIIDFYIIRPRTMGLLPAIIRGNFRFDPATGTLNVYGLPTDWTGPFYIVVEYTK